MAVVEDLISEVGQIGLWLQALGVVVVIAIVFNIISLLQNRRRLKEIHILKKDMKRIEGKIDKILKKSK